MGRRTFEKVLTFSSWPYDKPVYVLSTGKVEVPKDFENKVEIVNESPKRLVSQLKDLGHQNLYIDGGYTIQGFLEEDLIDEMIITRVSVLLGNGISLFGKLTQSMYFTIRKTETLNEVLEQSYYVRIRD
jgi:dihydrofolate reductase